MSRQGNLGSKQGDEVKSNCNAGPGGDDNTEEGTNL
jgi:hypothetical protein